ncbi:MAG: hypothetical protein MRY63_08445 [Neomegalonema sp.]|nr:hypothetical protein [Neomegalonema sp.]
MNALQMNGAARSHERSVRLSYDLSALGSDPAQAQKMEARRIRLLGKALHEALGTRLDFIHGDLKLPRALALDALNGMEAASFASAAHRLRTRGTLPVADPKSYGFFPATRFVHGLFAAEAIVLDRLAPLLRMRDPQKRREMLHSHEHALGHADTLFCLNGAAAAEAQLYLDAQDQCDVKALPIGGALEDAAAPAPIEIVHDGIRPLILLWADLPQRAIDNPLLAWLARDPGSQYQFDLVVIDEGSNPEDWRRLFDGLGLSAMLDEQVVILDRLEDHAARHLIDAALLVVGADLDGLDPHWLISAMAAEKPVLTSLGGANTDIGGGACRYFDPNQPGQFAGQFCEAFDAALAQPRNRLGATRARHFTWEMAAQTIIADAEEKLRAAPTLGTDWRGALHV